MYFSGDHEILNQTPKAETTVLPIKSKDELRALWKKAIIEQILLIRMEKENRKLQGNCENDLLKPIFQVIP